MKRALKRITNTVYHIIEGEKIPGVPFGVTGDLTGIRGDLTGIRGDLTGISGDLDTCEISDTDRGTGVGISDLVQ